MSKDKETYSLDLTNSKNYNKIRDCFLALKSPKGLNIYNDYYSQLMEYLKHYFKKLNLRLKSKYNFDQIKSSVLLDTQDALVEYYLKKFPEKQYYVNDSQTNKKEFALRPACCANAFAVWKNSFELKKNHIIHELGDCYRVENTGSLRSLSRGNYFEMYDYHMLVDLKEPEKVNLIMEDLRNQIALFYEQILNQSCKSKFYEFFRFTDKNYKVPFSQIYSENSKFEDLTDLKEKPYYCFKQEFTYTKKLPDLDKDLQLGTVQLDLANPTEYGLKGKGIIHFSPGSLPRLLDLLIYENKIPMLGIKTKILDSKIDLSSYWGLNYSLCIDKKSGPISEFLSIRSFEESIFYPLALIIGPKEICNNKYTIINRTTREEFSFSKEEITQYLKTFNFSPVLDFKSFF